MYAAAGRVGGMETSANEYIRIRVVLPHTTLAPVRAASHSLSGGSPSAAAAAVNTQTPRRACEQGSAGPSPAVNSSLPALARPLAHVGAAPASLACFLMKTPAPTWCNQAERNVHEGGHSRSVEQQQQQHLKHQQIRMTGTSEQQEPLQEHSERRRRRAKRPQKHVKVGKEPQCIEQPGGLQAHPSQLQQQWQLSAHMEQQQQGHAQKLRVQIEEGVGRNHLQHTQQPERDLPGDGHPQSRREAPQMQESLSPSNSKFRVYQEKESPAVAIEIDVALHETVADLRGVLMELLPSCLLTNYCIQWRNVFLEDTVPFSAIGLKQQDDLLLLPLLYDASALLTHLQRFKAVAVGCSSSVALLAAPATRDVITAIDEEDDVINEVELDSLSTIVQKQTPRGDGRLSGQAHRAEIVAKKRSAVAGEHLLLMRELPDPEDPTGSYGLFLKPLVLQQLYQEDKEQQPKGQHPQQKARLVEELYSLQQQEEDMLLALVDGAVDACCCAHSENSALRSESSEQRYSCCSRCYRSCAGQGSCCRNCAAVVREPLDSISEAFSSVSAAGDAIKFQPVQHSENTKDQQRQSQQEARKLLRVERHSQNNKLKEVRREAGKKPEQQKQEQWHEQHNRMDQNSADLEAAVAAAEETMFGQCGCKGGCSHGRQNTQCNQRNSSSRQAQLVHGRDSSKHQSSWRCKSILCCNHSHSSNPGAEPATSSGLKEGAKVNPQEASKGNSVEDVGGETQQHIRTGQNSSPAGDGRQAIPVPVIREALARLVTTPELKQVAYKKCVCCSKMEAALLKSPTGSAPPPGQPCVRRLEWHMFTFSPTKELARLRVLTLESQLLHICCRAEGFHVFAIAVLKTPLYNSTSPLEGSLPPGAASLEKEVSSSPSSTDARISGSSRRVGDDLCLRLVAPHPAAPTVPVDSFSHCGSATSADAARAAASHAADMSAGTSVADARAGAAAYSLSEQSIPWLAASAHCVCLPGKKHTTRLSVADPAATPYIFSSLGDLLAAYSPEFIERMNALAPVELDGDMPYRSMPLLRAHSHFVVRAAPSSCGCQQPGCKADALRVDNSSRQRTCGGTSGKKASWRSSRGDLCNGSMETDDLGSYRKNFTWEGPHEGAAAPAAFEDAASTARLNTNMERLSQHPGTSQLQSSRNILQRRQEEQLYTFQEEASARDAIYAAAEIEKQRCWNSEAAHVRQMSTGSLQDVIHREKAAYKLYYEFQQAALCAVEYLREPLALAVRNRRAESCSGIRRSTIGSICSVSEGNRRTTRTTQDSTPPLCNSNSHPFTKKASLHVATSRGIEFHVAKALTWPPAAEVYQHLHDDSYPKNPAQLQKTADYETLCGTARHKHRLFRTQELGAEMHGLELMERLQVLCEETPFNGISAAAAPVSAGAAAHSVTTAGPTTTANPAPLENIVGAANAVAATAAANAVAASATSTTATSAKPSDVDRPPTAEVVGHGSFRARPAAAADAAGVEGAHGSAAAASALAFRGEGDSQKQAAPRYGDIHRSSGGAWLHTLGKPGSQPRKQEQQAKRMQVGERRCGAHHDSRSGKEGVKENTAWRIAATYGILIDYKGIRVACKAPPPSLLQQQLPGERLCLPAAPAGAIADDLTGTSGNSFVSGEEAAKDLTGRNLMVASSEEKNKAAAVMESAGVPQAKTAGAAAEELLQTRVGPLLAMQAPLSSGSKTSLPLVSSIAWTADAEQQRIRTLGTDGVQPVNCTNELWQHNATDEHPRTACQMQTTQLPDLPANAAALSVGFIEKQMPRHNHEKESGIGARPASQADAAEKHSTVAEAAVAAASGRVYCAAEESAASPPLSGGEPPESNYLRPELLASYLAFRERRRAVDSARCRHTTTSISSSHSAHKGVLPKGKEEISGETVPLGKSGMEVVALDTGLATSGSEEAAAAANGHNVFTATARATAQAGMFPAAVPPSRVMQKEEGLPCKKSLLTPTEAAATEEGTASGVRDAYNKPHSTAFDIAALTATNAEETSVYSFDEELQFRVEQELNRRQPLMLSEALTEMRCWCKQDDGLRLLKAKGAALAVTAAASRAATSTLGSCAFPSDDTVVAGEDCFGVSPQSSDAAEEKNELSVREHLLPLVERVLLHCLLTSKAEQRANFQEQKELLLEKEPLLAVALQIAATSTSVRPAQEVAGKACVKFCYDAQDSTARRQQRHRRRPKQRQLQQGKWHKRGRSKEVVYPERQSAQVHENFEPRLPRGEQRPPHTSKCQGKQSGGLQIRGTRERHEAGSPSRGLTLESTLDTPVSAGPRETPGDGQPATIEENKDASIAELLEFHLCDKELQLLQHFPVDVDVSLLVDGLNISTRAREMAAELLQQALALPSLSGYFCDGALPLPATPSPGDDNCQAVGVEAALAVHVTQRTVPDSTKLTTRQSLPLATPDEPSQPRLQQQEQLQHEQRSWKQGAAAAPLAMDCRPCADAPSFWEASSCWTPCVRKGVATAALSSCAPATATAPAAAADPCRASAAAGAAAVGNGIIAHCAAAAATERKRSDICAVAAAAAETEEEESSKPGALAATGTTLDVFVASETAAAATAGNGTDASAATAAMLPFSRPTMEAPGGQGPRLCQKSSNSRGVRANKKSEDTALSWWDRAADRRIGGDTRRDFDAAARGGDFQKASASFANVREASLYLHHVAVPLLCELLVKQVANNSILESSTLKQFFHYCGVNLRYIGVLAAFLQNRIRVICASSSEPATNFSYLSANPFVVSRPCYAFSPSSASSLGSTTAELALTSAFLTCRVSTPSSGTVAAADAYASAEEVAMRTARSQCSLVADSSGVGSDSQVSSSSTVCTVADDDGSAITCNRKIVSSTDKRSCSAYTRGEHEHVVLKVLLLELAIRCATYCFNAILSRVGEAHIPAAAAHLLSCLLCPETADYPSEKFPMPPSIARFALASCDGHQSPLQHVPEVGDEPRQKVAPHRQQHYSQYQQQQPRLQKEKHHQMRTWGSGTTRMWFESEDVRAADTRPSSENDYSASYAWYDISARDLWKYVELRMRTHFNYHVVFPPNSNSDIRAAWPWLAKPSSRYRLLRGVCSAVGLQLSATHQFGAFLSASSVLSILEPWHDYRAPAAAVDRAHAPVTDLQCAPTPAATSLYKDIPTIDSPAYHSEVTTPEASKISAAVVPSRQPVPNVKTFDVSTGSTDREVLTSSPALSAPEKAHRVACMHIKVAQQKAVLSAPSCAGEEKVKDRRNSSRQRGSQLAQHFNAFSGRLATRESSHSSGSDPTTDLRASCGTCRAEECLQVAEAYTTLAQEFETMGTRLTGPTTDPVRASEEVAGEDVDRTEPKMTGAAAAATVTTIPGGYTGTSRNDALENMKELPLEQQLLPPHHYVDNAPRSSRSATCEAADHATAPRASEASSLNWEGTQSKPKLISSAQKPGSNGNSKQQQQEQQDSSEQPRPQPDGMATAKQQQQQHEQKHFKLEDCTWQPLHLNTFCRCFPVVKTNEPVSLLIRGLLATATEACVVGWLDVALEIYQHTLYIIHQQTGAVRREAALCYAAMGHVMLALEEYLNACNYFQKALILMERLEGVDHPSTIELHVALSRSLAELPGEVYMRRSIQHLLRALLLLRLWDDTPTAAEEMALLLLLAAKRTQQCRQLSGQRCNCSSSNSNSSTEDTGIRSSGSVRERKCQVHRNIRTEKRCDSGAKKKFSNTLLHMERVQAGNGSWCSQHEKRYESGRIGQDAKEGEQELHGYGRARNNATGLEQQQQLQNGVDETKKSSAKLEFFLSTAASLLEMVHGRNPTQQVELHADIAQCYYVEENYRQAFYHCRRAHQLVSGNRNPATATPAEEVHSKKLKEHLMLLMHQAVLAERRRRGAATQGKKSMGPCARSRSTKGTGNSLFDNERDVLLRRMQGMESQQPPEAVQPCTQLLGCACVGR